MAPSPARVLLAALMLVGPAQAATEQHEVRSADGTPIAFECAGTGPEILIVHGGTGDRSRWTPMIPYLEDRFTVCVMARRGHGKSGDTAEYSLDREARDVAAVVESRGRPVTVLGHSLGAVCAFEAAFLTPKVARLILYEPPLRVGDASAVLDQMQTLIDSGRDDEATATFLREIVRVSPAELAAMRERPVWKSLVSSVQGSLRQHRALMNHAFDPARVATLTTPTLVIVGAETTNADLKRSAQSLLDTLPSVKARVLEDQEHNAMDSARGRLAEIIRAFAGSSGRESP